MSWFIDKKQILGRVDYVQLSRTSYIVRFNAGLEKKNDPLDSKGVHKCYVFNKSTAGTLDNDSSLCTRQCLHANTFQSILHFKSLSQRWISPLYLDFLFSRDGFHLPFHYQDFTSTSFIEYKLLTLLRGALLILSPGAIEK